METTQKMKFVNISDDAKKVLLKALGFSINENGIVCLNDKPYECPYTKRAIHYKEASILPGSLVVMNTTALSVSEYISEHQE